tara:strand:+ start:154 stop:330 length:177 start_codon:yes stop_codon:yes gene_type:complete
MSSNDIDYFDEGFEDEIISDYISGHRILTTFEIIELLNSLPSFNKHYIIQKRKNNDLN